MRLLVFEDGYKKVVTDLSKDFNSHKGVIRREDLVSGGVVSSSTGERVLVVEPSLFDLFSVLERGPQVITFKDAGYIILRANVPGSRVLEVGGGSGFLTCLLSLFAEEVVTYEKKRDNVKLIERNLRFFNKSKVVVRCADAYKELDEDGLFDVLIVDVNEPWRVPLSFVKQGGFVVFFVLNVEQLQRVKALKGLIVEEVCEIVKRDWRVDNISRPKSKMIAHTGFLVFCRKV